MGVVFLGTLIVLGGISLMTFILSLSDTTVSHDPSKPLTGLSFI